LRLLKKFFLLAAEFAFLFFGFAFSMGLADYVDSIGGKFAPAMILIGFALVCATLVWFRRKTGKWTITADANAWLAHRIWGQLHPSGARCLRVFQRSFIWLPNLCAAFVLFFLPVASHIWHFGTYLAPHYRFSTPLNWLIIESPGGNFTWTFFGNQGAARYGLTPNWFTHSMPSNAAFITGSREGSDGWSRPEGELASGHTTHIAMRQFQLGRTTAACYEYRHTYGCGATSAFILTPPVLWESLCSTKPNGVDHNLRASFFGHEEDLPAFYEMLNSATPSN
jgi:hypothetical protein